MKFRPEADIWPLEPDEKLKTLARDIDLNGQLEPIKLYEGDILDGRNRYLAITRYGTSGREPKYEDVSPSSPIAYVLSYNEHRRHLNDSQRAMAGAKAEPFFAAEAKKRQQAAGPASVAKREGRSGPIGPQRARARDQAAATVGASPRSVQRAKSVINNGSKKLADAVHTGALSLGKAEQIVKETPDRRQQDKRVVEVAKSKMATRVKGLTGEIEWYTPRQYLDAAVEVMGGIELDPASSTAAQEHVQADRWFTLAEDGLAQPWTGRVFLNPPYAMPAIKQFTNKLVDSFTAGDVTEAIFLTNNATDTEWFHTAAQAAAAICFTRGRISFLQARDGELLEKCSPTHGQAFFYFGPNARGFKAVFSTFGITLRKAG